MMKRKMTRRNFLKVAAAVSAAGVMSACGGDGMPPASSGNGNTGNTGNAGDTGNSGETPDNGSGGDSGEEEEVIETTGSIEKQTIWFRMERLKSRAIMERWSLMW